MKPKSSLIHFPRLAVITLTLAASASSLTAASLYWDGNSTTADADGGAGTWSTAATTNWNDAAVAGNAVPWTDGSDAVFGGVAGTVTVSGTVSTPSLTFNTTAYTVSGGTISLSGTPTINTGANNATLSSVIAGGAGFNKTGTGTLTLSGANTYTGNTLISAGTIKPANSGTTLGLTTLTTTVASGGAFDFNGQNLGAEVFTIAGTGVGGTGALLNTGGSQTQAVRFVTLSAAASVGGTGRWDIRANSSATLNMGGFTLSKVGTNDFHLTGISVTNPGNIDVTTGQFWVELSTLFTGSATNTLTLRSGSGLYQYQNNVAHAWKVNMEANSSWESNNGTNAWAGPVALAGVSNLTSQAGTTMTNSGIVSGSGSIVKAGTGTWFFSAANTYTGATTVNAGTLAFTNTNSSSSYSIASGAILELQNQTMPVSATISGTGTLRKTQTGTLQWATTAATFALGSGGLIDVQAGTFTGGSNANEVWTSNLADLNVVSGATFNGVEANVKVDALSGAGTIASGFSGSGYAAFTFGVDNGSAAFSGALANSSAVGNFIKAGTGTQILSGTNTYTGTTTINGGVLEFLGSSAFPSSLITVNGTGTFRSDTPGRTFTAITANNSSILSVPAKTGATTNVTGALTLTNGATISVAPALGNLAPGTYDLITAGSISGTGTPVLDLNSYGASRATGSVAVVGNKLQLTLTGTGAALVWNNASASGVATGTWDLALANFNNGGSNDVFKAFDAVTFDDTLLPGTAKTVNLGVGAVLAPSLLTVNNSSPGNYTFGSTGTLTGAGSLVKSGSGTLTISATTGYTMLGDITVSGGTVDFGAKTLTPSKVSLTGGALNNATVSTANAATLDFQSGSATALFTGSGAWAKTTGGAVSLTAANTLTGPGVISAGTLNLGSSATLGTGTVSLASGATLTVARAGNGLALSNSFSGTGAITLTGNNNGVASNGSEVIFNGANSGFSGPIAITGARSRGSGTGTLGSGSVSIAGLGGQIYLVGGTYANPMFITGNGWAEGTGLLGALRLEGGTTTGTITLTGNSRINAHANSGTLSGPIVESGGSRNLEFGGSSGLSNLTLSGASTYTGTTTLTLANVTLNGSLGATAVTVGGTSTLGGTGSIGSGGSLTFTTGATLAANTGSPITVNGNVTLGATTNVTLVPGVGQPSGVIPVLNFTGSITGTTSNLSLTNLANYRQGIFAITATQITVDIGMKSLVWNGTSGGQWTTAGTNLRWNTTGTGETDAFYPGDAVTFNDTGVATTIALSGVVQPSAITVNNSTNNYTFTETGANYISGGASLVKSGTGTLTLNGAQNTFTGGTTVNGGTIVAGAPNGTTYGSLGAGPVTVNNGGTVSVAGDNGAFGQLAPFPKNLRINAGGVVTSLGGASGHLQYVVLNGGTLSAATANGTYTNWNLDFGVSTLGNGSTSAISGGNVSLTQTGGTVFNIGAGDLVNVTSVIAHVSGANDFGLIKQGTGTLNLASSNTYTSLTTVSAGTLLVTNSTGSATGTNTVTVASGATLAGYGRITGVVSSAGKIAPGDASASLLFLGATTLTGNYACELDGASSDQLVIGGDFNITGASLTVSTLPGGANQSTYIIAAYSGNLVGTFTTSGVPSGYTVNYNTAAKQIELVKAGYDSFIAAYPGLSDTTAGGDPDNDDIKNLLEYVLGGNPGVGGTGILPTQTLVGGNLVFTYKRAQDSKGDTTQTVQWSDDLATWHDIAVPAASAGAVTITNNSPAADDVSVAIPQTGTKIFARLKVTNP